jgi:hypothetical protein
MTVSVTVHHKRAIVVGLVLISLIRDEFHDELDKSVIDHDGSWERHQKSVMY